jgi:hypothetical protein
LCQTLSKAFEKSPDKTEIMLFKIVENSTNFYFYFDEKLIPLTSDHKHLGITFNDIFYLIFILACIAKGSIISKQSA